MRALSLEQQHFDIFHSKMIFLMRASSLKQQNVKILHKKSVFTNARLKFEKEIW